MSIFYRPIICDTVFFIHQLQNIIRLNIAFKNRLIIQIFRNLTFINRLINISELESILSIEFSNAAA